MRRILPLMRAPLRDRRGVAAVEFALAAPIVLGLLFGVLQIGLLMLGYNAMRELAGEMGRYTVVQYMTGNKLTDVQIETATIAKSSGSGSGIRAANIDVDAVTATTSSVPGVKQIDLHITYAVVNVLPFYPGESFNMTITKPILVYDE